MTSAMSWFKGHVGRASQPVHRRRGNAVLRVLLFCLLAVASSVWPSWGWTQQRLIDEEPYDLITIPDDKETKALKVFPLNLPNRRPPKDPKPTEKIRVRLFDDEEDRTFELMWRDIKKLELFEDRILAEAEQFTAEQKFDDAYTNYAFLLKTYPNTRGLDASIQSYWYLSAGASYREKRYDEALAVLEELLKKNPSYKHSDTSPSLMRVLGEIVDKLVQGYLEKKDFRSARQMVVRITRAYPDSKQEPFFTRYQERVQGEAERKREEARAHLAARRYTEAYDATAAMLDIWPDVSGARELTADMARQYPLAAIAVEQLSSAPNALRLNQWADFRTGRLTDRRLTELRGIGPEGGNYVCPLGTCERSEDGRSLTITLRPDASVGTYDVLQLLLSAAGTESHLFSPEWAQVLGTARIVKTGQLEATLRRPHVLPQALLAFPLSAQQGERGQSMPSSASYVLQVSDATRSRFVLPAEVASLPGRPREIQERLFTDPEAAILALERGEIEAIDRVQPSDLAVVRALSSVIVGGYAVPTVHVLVPNADRIWPASRTFRRAIIYGIQREVILKQGILRNQSLDGAEVLSGPFPAPLATNDPLSYAYDTNIVPHAYEPLLAATLVDLAKRELTSAAQAKGEEPPKFEGIVIGHLPLELHRIACKAMSQQLTPLGIACKTQELAANDPAASQCDFVYTELVVAEPVIDAGRLFGPGGLYPATNPHIRLGVRQVEQATNWNQAGARLRQLHRLLHEDLTMLPLWQVPEHYAVRQNVHGLTAAPVSLYQDIDQWRVAPRLGQN